MQLVPWGHPKSPLGLGGGGGSRDGSYLAQPQVPEHWPFLLTFTSAQLLGSSQGSV